MCVRTAGSSPSQELQRENTQTNGSSPFNVAAQHIKSPPPLPPPEALLLPAGPERKVRGLVLTETPGGQREDRWRLTAAALLLCHAVFLWRRLVGLSQFETSGQVSAFIEYMELKIAPGSPMRAQRAPRGDGSPF